MDKKKYNIYIIGPLSDEIGVKNIGIINKNNSFVYFEKGRNISNKDNSEHLKSEYLESILDKIFEVDNEIELSHDIATDKYLKITRFIHTSDYIKESASHFKVITNEDSEYVNKINDIKSNFDEENKENIEKLNQDVCQISPVFYLREISKCTVYPKLAQAINNYLVDSNVEKLLEKLNNIYTSHELETISVKRTKSLRKILDKNKLKNKERLSINCNYMISCFREKIEHDSEEYNMYVLPKNYLEGNDIYKLLFTTLETWLEEEKKEHSNKHTDSKIPNYLKDLVEFVFIDKDILIDTEKVEKLYIKIDKKKNFKSTVKIPQIFIGFDSIKDLFSGKENYAQIFYKKIRELDNNIWGFYIQIISIEEFYLTIRQVFKKILRNHELQLYHTTVADEYLDIFKKTVAINSLSKGHANQVIPYIYASESDKEEKANELITELSESLPLDNKSNRLTVKVLMLDDFAHINLRTNKKGFKFIEDKKIGPQILKSTNEMGKSKILIKLWESFCAQTKPNLPIDLNIYTCDSVDFWAENNSAENDAKDLYFDIILLDYNFNSTKNGIDFIRNLKSDEQKNQNIIRTKKITTSSNKEPQNEYYKLFGPFQQCYIMPISSFSNAFGDDMRNNGIEFTDRNYRLFHGADLVTTPYAFLFCFLTVINTISKSVIKALKLPSELKGKDTFNKKVGEIQSLDNYLKISEYFNFLNDKLRYTQYLNSFCESDNLIESIKNLIPFNRNEVKRKAHYHNFLYNSSWRDFKGNEDIFIDYNLILNLIENTSPNEKNK